MKSTQDESMLNFWGKADQENQTWHPVALHSLDVAAVTVSMLQASSIWRRKLEALLRLEGDQLLEFLGFIAGIHDIGKFAANFQAKVPELRSLLAPESSPAPAGPHHTDAGWLLWRCHTWPSFLANLDEKQRRGLKKQLQALESLVAASIGHHGAPPREMEMDVATVTFRALYPDLTRGAIDNYIEQLHELFPGFRKVIQLWLAAPDSAALWKQASFLVSGLLVLADWLGSATEYFPHQVSRWDRRPASVALSEYWNATLHRARSAIELAGLLPSATADRLDLDTLMGGQKSVPSPLQAKATDIPLPPKPALFILEDIAGGGKTEAALLLGHRLMQRGEADGIYFALPTMATSNGMYSRMQNVYRSLFVSGTMPSLVLSHSGRNLSTEFQESILSIPPLVERQYETDITPSGAICAQWLADKSKKTFLAQVGVGSIDQALLAAIHSKHHTLRIFGLSSRILIVDEVHAYDPYMLRLLGTLLQYQAQAGVSVILLSATLPAGTKHMLTAEYRKGQTGDAFEHAASNAASTLEQMAAAPFPSLEYGNAFHSSVAPVAARKESVRKIAINFLETEQQVVEILERTVQSNGCAVWIRNTVSDVQDAYEQLYSRLGSRHVQIFHSRYIFAHRDRIERTVLDGFGKESGAEQRQGKVLIASQVVEQSLDLDFDCMVTDLCPVDLIMQRAGRLQRHARTLNGNRTQDNDERGSPTLHVYGPLATAHAEEDWYSSYFEKASFVYPDVARLWLTAHLLERAGSIDLPHGARALLEGVYSSHLNEIVPSELRKLSARALVDFDKARGRAGMHIVEPDRGYLRHKDSNPWEESRAPTRLSQETVTYRLCLVQDNALVPLANDSPQPWATSELKCRKLPDLDYPDSVKQLIKKTNGSIYDRGAGGVLLPVHPEDNGIYSIIGNQELLYDAAMGLRPRKGNPR